MESPGMTKELHHAPPIRKERVLNATPLNSQFSRTMKPAPVLKPLENPDAKVGELSRVEFRIDSASNSVIARIRMRGNSFTPAIREKLEGIGSQKAPRSLANSDGEVEIQILKNPHEFQRSEIPRIEALFNDDRPGNLDVTGLMEAPLVRYLLACGSPPGSTAVTNGRGIKLKNVVLRAENYSGMSFSEAQLENVAFVGCDLVATSFKNVRGTRVLFDSCNAHYADFGNSMFSHSSFSSEVSALSKSSKGVNTLKGASFNNARMSDSSFRNCDLRGADLRGLMQDDLDRELGKGRFGDGVAGLEKKSKEIALTQIRLKNWTGSVFRMSGEGATLLDDDQRQLFISLSDTCSVTTPVKMSPHKALQVIERNPLTRSMNCYRLVSPAGTVISIDPDFERSTMGILVENPSPSGGIVSSELSEGRLNDDPDVVVRHILALFLEEEEVALSRRRNKLRNETYV